MPKLSDLIEKGCKENPDIEHGTGFLAYKDVDNQRWACAIGYAALGSGVSFDFLVEIDQSPELVHRLRHFIKQNAAVDKSDVYADKEFLTSDVIHEVMHMNDDGECSIEYIVSELKERGL